MAGDTGKLILSSLLGLAGLALAGASAHARKPPPPNGLTLRSNPALKPEELQQGLIDALTLPPEEIDPYDFWSYVYTYLEEDGWSYQDMPDEMEWLEQGTNKRDFIKWIKRNRILESWKSQDPGTVPARYYFSRPTALPKGQWLVHHSDVSFGKFDRGATMEHLALTWSANAPEKAGPKNLDDSVTDYERVFAFAFAVEEDECIARDGRYKCHGRPKYGKSMVLFQCDAAIEAYHEGDEETQAIFPIGTEYNLHFISGVEGEGSWWLHGESGEEDIEFPTIHALIEHLENASKKAKKSKGKRLWHSGLKRRATEKEIEEIFSLEHKALMALTEAQYAGVSGQQLEDLNQAHLKAKTEYVASINSRPISKRPIGSNRPY